MNASTVVVNYLIPPREQDHAVLMTRPPPATKPWQYPECWALKMNQYDWFNIVTQAINEFHSMK